jgi:hypothetical protein
MQYHTTKMQNNFVANVRDHRYLPDGAAGAQEGDR